MAVAEEVEVLMAASSMRMASKAGLASLVGVAASLVHAGGLVA
ncbi:hypothetical protein AB0O34_31535 [Sphaerisporangium sp. NPDC088356]